MDCSCFFFCVIVCFCFVALPEQSEVCLPYDVAYLAKYTYYLVSVWNDEERDDDDEAAKHLLAGFKKYCSLDDLAQLLRLTALQTGTCSRIGSVLGLK